VERRAIVDVGWALSFALVGRRGGKRRTTVDETPSGWPNAIDAIEINGPSRDLAGALVENIAP
jgi:hypothetical protein